MRNRRAFAASGLCLLAACATAPPPEKKEPPPPPKPVTGLTAVFRCYQMARQWAPDALPLRVQSVNLESVKGEDGKAGAWRSTFYSAAKGRKKDFTWSAIEGEGFHKDVFALQEESFTPSRQIQPFRIEALRTDTDKAWDVAAKKSAEYIKKNPGKSIFYLAEWTDRFPNPSWRVVWGDTISQSGYSIFVDTATGEYLQTGR